MPDITIVYTCFIIFSPLLDIDVLIDAAAADTPRRLRRLFRRHYAPMLDMIRATLRDSASKRGAVYDLCRMFHDAYFAAMMPRHYATILLCRALFQRCLLFVDIRPDHDMRRATLIYVIYITRVYARALLSRLLATILPTLRRLFFACC